MRWSFEELAYAWKLYSEKRLLNFIRRFPSNFARRIKLLFRWIFKGYASETLWSLDSYLLDVIIFRLKMFVKMKKAGYAQDFESSDKWQNALEELLTKLEIMQSESILEDLRYPDDLTIKDIVDGREVTRLNFGNEEERKYNEELFEKQEKNNEEALDLLRKHFLDLWD